MIGLYGLGFLAAVATARLLKSTLLKRQSPLPFTLELPPYRWPTLQSIGLRLADRSLIFLKRAGTVILLTTVVLWFLASVPRTDGEAPEISQSFAGSVGRAVEPVIEPLGFNWKIGIGLITSLAAREVIVGTLGTIYGIEGGEEEGDVSSPGLQQALKQDLTPGAAVALLIFFAFALQCMSTVAVVRRGDRWLAAGPAAICLHAGSRLCRRVDGEDPGRNLDLTRFAEGAASNRQRQKDILEGLPRSWRRLKRGPPRVGRGKDFPIQ